MMSKRALCLALALLAGGCQSSSSQVAEVAGVDGPRRTFTIRYVAEVKDLPQGKRLQLWIPIPHNDPYQKISDLKVDSPWPHKVTTDPKWKNTMLYLEGKASAPSLKVTVSYRVQRAENKGLAQQVDAAVAGPSDVAQRHLQPTRLVVVNKEIRTRATTLQAKATNKKASKLDLAQSFYARILKDMTYDKSGMGWGRGDSKFACRVGRGNCTDFHSYFMAMCLVAKIPSRFQIGLYGKFERKPGQEYKLGGYHCWAEFAVPGRKRWIPVDISEADKHPQRRDYFFGNHTDNRVTLTTGRDLVLAPPQKGAPLNYFVHPYAEVDGEPFQASKTAYWTDE